MCTTVAPTTPRIAECPTWSIVITRRPSQQVRLPNCSLITKTVVLSIKVKGTTVRSDSSRVGARHDLVKGGLNGYIVSVGDMKALSDRLRFVISNPDMSKEMGRKNLRRISALSFYLGL